MSSAQSHPFDLLNELEQRYRQHSDVGSEVQQSGEIIAGRLALRCGPWYLSLAMNEVAEIIPVPRHTRVPGVQPWLLGIANLRGRVITVVDLGQYLCGNASRQTPTSRIVVADSSDWRYGLLIDEVIGMRYFGDSTAPNANTALDPAIRPYIRTITQSEDKQWLAFDLNALLKSRKFLDASV